MSKRALDKERIWLCVQKVVASPSYSPNVNYFYILLHIAVCPANVS